MAKQAKVVQLSKEGSSYPCGINEKILSELVADGWEPKLQIMSQWHGFQMIVIFIKDTEKDELKEEIIKLRESIETARTKKTAK